MMTNSSDTEDNRSTTPKVSNELVQQETAANVAVERDDLKARDETTLKAKDEVGLGAERDLTDYYAALAPYTTRMRGADIAHLLTAGGAPLCGIAGRANPFGRGTYLEEEADCQSCKTVANWAARVGVMKREVGLRATLGSRPPREFKRFLFNGRSLSKQLKRQNPLTTERGLSRLKEWRREFEALRPDYAALFRAIDNATGITKP